MLTLGEPARTPYDLQFSIFNFPVRISALFWSVGALTGQMAAQAGVQFLLVWIAALFASILIHELGHTFAFRYFGISSHIVLYHFGGLAIPDGHGRAWSSSMRQDDPRASIIISAAGPAVQMLSALVLILGVNFAGYGVDLDPISRLLVPAQTGEPLPNQVFRFFMLQYCFISIYWALVNLLPVFPLDGGNIARNLMRMYSNPAMAVPYSLMLSVGVAAAMAVWGLSQQRMFVAIMFGMLGYSSYQQLQLYQGPSRW